MTQVAGNGYGGTTADRFLKPNLSYQGFCQDHSSPHPGHPADSHPPTTPTPPAPAPCVCVSGTAG